MNAHVACLAFVPPVGHKKYASVHWQFLAARVDGSWGLVEVDSGAAHMFDFADRAVTPVLRADSDGVSAVGASLEQLVTTADEGESFSSFVASVLAVVGPSLKFNAELCSISFTLHVSCVGMIPNASLLSGLSQSTSKTSAADHRRTETNA